MILSEEATEGVLSKKVFLKMLQISQGNFALESLFNKSASLKAQRSCFL